MTYEKRGRGKPQTWSVEELKKIAVDVKHKSKNIKITPSLLEKATGIGRNTWTRRIPQFIEELNTPVHTHINLNENGEVILPSIDLILGKLGITNERIANEFYILEEIIHFLYFELKQTRQLNLELQKNKQESEILLQSLKESKIQAKHFENLYTKIIASSMYPHLLSKSNILKDNNIKESLLDFDNDKKNMNVSNLSVFFENLEKETHSDNNGDEIMDVIKKKYRL